MSEKRYSLYVYKTLISISAFIYEVLVALLCLSTRGDSSLSLEAHLLSSLTQINVVFCAIAFGHSQQVILSLSPMLRCTVKSSATC